MTTAAAPILEARDLFRFYGAGEEEALALRGVSLTVDPGEVVAVMGPSGSGKSTLLACLAGLDAPSGGTVRIDGERMSRRTEPERARLRATSVGMLFSAHNLLDHVDVLGNVLLAQRVAGTVDRERAHRLLDALGLGERAHARPSTLSGGEAIRAGLAVALANDPPLLLADEPTGELDERTAAAVIALLTARAADGAAVVVATHDPAVATAADRVLTLRDGMPA